MDLVLENVSKGFEEKSIIEDASFRFQQGKIYGLLGRNGSET